MSRTLFLAAPLVAALALVGCKPGAAPVAGFQDVAVTTPTGKTTVSLSLIGANMVRAASLANVAADVVVIADAKAAPYAAVVRTASVAVQATAQSLETSGAVTGDTQANLNALSAAFNAVVAGVGTLSGADAAKVQAAADAIKQAVAMVQSAIAAGAVPAPAPVTPVVQTPAVAPVVAPASGA